MPENQEGLLKDAMLRLLQNVSRHGFFIQALCKGTLKTTVATTRMGYIWWIVDPIIMMFIYYFMVRIVFDRGGENYHLFALCGIVTWQFFSRTMRLTAGSLKQNISLMKQVHVPAELFTLAPLLVQSVFALIGLCIVALWNYPALGPHTVLVLPVLALTGLSAYVLGLFFAVVTPWFPDMDKFIDYGLRAGFFVTPILYPASRVLENEHVAEVVRRIFQSNPMAWTIPATRDLLLDGAIFDFRGFVLWTCLLLVLAQVALGVLRANISEIIKRT